MIVGVSILAVSMILIAVFIILDCCRENTKKARTLQQFSTLKTLSYKQSTLEFVSEKSRNASSIKRSQTVSINTDLSTLNAAN